MDLDPLLFLLVISCLHHVLQAVFQLGKTHAENSGWPPLAWVNHDCAMLRMTLDDSTTLHHKTSKMDQLWPLAQMNPCIHACVLRVLVQPELLQCHPQNALT